MNLVEQEIIIDVGDINSIIDNSNKIIVFDDNEAGILGFSTFRIWGKDKNKADIYTYVVPDSRNKGIGTLLYHAEGLRISFYELRKLNDFQPYLCCELNEEKRKEFLDNKENLFLLLNNEKLVASVIVYKNGFIGDMFVLPSYQGKGYGKKSMQFDINKDISKVLLITKVKGVSYGSKR